MEHTEVTLAEISNRFGEVATILATPSSEEIQNTPDDIDFKSLPLVPTAKQRSGWLRLIKAAKDEKNRTIQQFIAGTLLLHARASINHPHAPQTLEQDVDTLAQRLATIAEAQTLKALSSARKSYPPTVPASRNTVGDEKPQKFDQSAAKVVVGPTQTAKDSSPDKRGSQTTN